MISLIRSRIAIKLTLSLAATLCLVMAGLAAIYFTVVDRLMTGQEARAALYRELNQGLRDEVFHLQARLVDIPKQLQTDPIPALQAWAREGFETELRTYEGRDRIVERFTGRQQRRDVQQENRIVVVADGAGAAMAYGIFKDGAFTDSVEELVLKGADPAAVTAKVEAVLGAATGADVLKERVAALSTALIDDAMAAETTRNAILGQADRITLEEHEVARIERQARFLVAGASVAAILLANLLVWVVMRRMITGALSRLSHAATAIADGRDSDVGYTRRTDEVGELAKGVARFRETLAEIEALKIEQEAERAAREAALHDRLDALSEALEQGMGARVGVVTGSTDELVGIGSSLNRLAGETLARASESTGLAERSAQFTDQVMAVVTALRETAERISAEVQTQRRLTREVAAEAEQVSALVQELAATAGQIGGVVTLIEEIANQTKLLALNATIEASRAGEAGAGFAVVAGEVKKLSGETAEATQRIADQVASFDAGIRNAAAAVASIRARVRSVDDGIHVAAGEVEEMSRETAGIAEAVAEVAANARQVAAVNQAVDAAAQQTGSMSGHMAELTDRITAAVEDMRQHLRAILADAAGRPATAPCASPRGDDPVADFAPRPLLALAAE